MEETLILYDGAERMLQKIGVDPKSVDADEIRADYQKMLARKSALENTYKSAEKEAKSLQQKYANVEQYLGSDNKLENRTLALFMFLLKYLDFLHIILLNT